MVSHPLPVFVWSKFNCKPDSLVFKASYYHCLPARQSVTQCLFSFPKYINLFFIVQFYFKKYFDVSMYNISMQMQLSTIVAIIHELNDKNVGARRERHIILSV